MPKKRKKKKRKTFGRIKTLLFLPLIETLELELDSEFSNSLPRTLFFFFPAMTAITVHCITPGEKLSGTAIISTPLPSYWILDNLLNFSILQFSHNAMGIKMTLWRYASQSTEVDNYYFTEIEIISKYLFSVLCSKSLLRVWGNLKSPQKEIIYSQTIFLTLQKVGHGISEVQVPRRWDEGSSSFMCILEFSILKRYFGKWGSLINSIDLLFLPKYSDHFLTLGSPIILAYKGPMW